MAKGSKKSTVPKTSDQSPGPALENLGANFLSKLTQRIEAGVGESKNPEHKSDKDRKPKSTISEPRQAPQSTTKLQINGKGNQSVTNDDKRGKKRDRDGSIIQSNAQSRPPTQHIRFDKEGEVQDSASKQKSSPNGDGIGSSAKKDPSGSKKDVLFQEILALGGTEEDLALVDGLDTDSEVEETIVKETKKVKNPNKKDIEAFMKEIGLGGGSFDDSKFINDADVAAEEGDSEDWTEDDQDEDDEAEEEEDGGDSDAEMASVEKISAAPNGNAAPAKPIPQLTQLPTKGPLILEPQQDWYNIVLPELPLASDSIGPVALSSLRTMGQELLATENSNYMAYNLSKDTNLQFLSQIMTSGTVEDKISALTIVCTSSSLHTTKTLESLHNLAKKKSRNQTIASLVAIKDLFANGSVLPSDRKLIPFSKQPLADLLEYQKVRGEDQVFKAYLLLWTFEDWLKDFYFEVLKTLEVIANDTGVTWSRMKAIDMIFELLKEKPEGETNLMRLLVNKLGDPDRKVASKTSHLLLQLQVAHPAMKSVIISSIESDALFKSAKNSHARYYSIITLNQTILTRSDDSVANQLLRIYFALFADILGNTNLPPKATKPKKDEKLSQRAKKRIEKEKKDAELEEESNSKSISAILSGVNRAFPFASIDDDVFNNHLDTLFRITHGSNFNTSIQALTLIFQVSSSKQMVSDRFYRSLYGSLLDHRLANSSKQAMYLNMLFRALKSDHKLARVQAFVKRIIQTASMHQPPFICGVLYLLRELEGTFPTLKNMLDKPLDDDSEEEDFKDVDDERAVPLKEEGATKKGDKDYDGKKRDPLYANADRSSFWELIPFLSHFHPTVSLYANSLYTNSSMPSKPDMALHTLTHFLDRFVYRNAKSSATKGSSIMQPLAGGDTRGMILSTKTAGRGLVPVNSEAFSNMKAENVKEDEVFFHKFFTMRKQSETAGKAQKQKKKVDEDDEDSEFDDDEAWEAMVESRPDLDLDDDEDVDMDDFDEDGLDAEMSDMDDDDGEMDGLTTDAFGDLDDEELEGGASDDSDIEEDGGSDSEDINLDDSDLEAGIDSDDEIPSDIDAKLAEVTKAVKKSKGKAAAAAPAVKETRGEKRRKLKSLPVFASADDYATLLGQDAEEDL